MENKTLCVFDCELYGFDGFLAYLDILDYLNS